MKSTLVTKLIIIQNFIDNFTSNEAERLQMYAAAEMYVDEDHVDEVESYIDDLKLGAFKMEMDFKEPDICSELIDHHKLSKATREKYFECDEYGSIEILLDKQLNVVGGKLIPFQD